MLKFFRKIRKGLVEERKISNYILYAIGEIVLVVIGILIALAIDNANEQHIKREKEQVYLVGLKKEFETSQTKLKNLIAVNKKSYEDSKKIIGFMQDQENLPNEEELSNLLYNALAFDISYNPNNSLLEEMINSGSLKDLSNPNLRVLLTNWISNIEDITKQEAMLDHERDQIITMFRRNGNSIKTIYDLTGVSGDLGLPVGKEQLSNLHLLQSTEFENNLLMFILTSITTETLHYTPLMQSMNEILATINGEIKE
ncbi:MULTISPECIES: DUF6090 family protein [Flagellimonas]|uniref:Uncharacterized protein n=2 Tax=Flagellimonas TaxID=444459 RepID=A0A3A1NE43_9FLAO|nr:MULTISPECIES: DUF6090 family protein [Allomuricauda]RIV42941.1 hypothetical protein D2V05_15110 [Allomuricauda maritima]RIV73860.1 hypothetical protein D2U88_02150 [Allomuricauda aequoris]TXJ92139.1 hypothetical protein FQ017_14975 [Allomuricauda maritima]TXK07547.1 hypothetical protein FQ019_02130 [Allomuricauda aequoris]